MITKTMKLEAAPAFLYAAAAAVTAVALLFAGFLMAEPRIGHAQTSEFTISQTIVDETTFLVEPADVTMNGNINGVTGGNATGTTQFVVRSNNSTGYYVEIDFFDNVGAYAMLGETTGSEALRDYGGDVGGEPSYGFTASSAAQFAFTVLATTTSDLDQSFQNNGAACNAGSAQYPSGAYCWKAPTTTNAFRIIDRSTSAIAGATSTIQFKVNVPSGATPVPEAETYTATATLSVFIQ